MLSGLQTLRQGVSSLSLEEFVVNTLELLMHLERDEYLVNLKTKSIIDKGNGTYPRSFKSLSQNALLIHIPRTRYTDFKPFAIEFLKYSQEQVNELVLTLYTKGLTTRDVADVFNNFFGHDISYAQVSNLAERFHELRLAWEASALEAYYKVVYCDAIYITVKRGDSYSKEAVHLIYGLREDNKPELLDLSINSTESAASWAESIAKMKQRGLKQVDLFVADGINGLEEEVAKVFPQACFQKCVVHKMRYMLNKVRPKDKHEVAKDLKDIFDNFEQGSSLQQAKVKVEVFVDKWGKIYPELEGSLVNQASEYYFTYIKFPVSVRRSIYSTNSMENLNKKIRKATKNKLSFESPERLLDYLFVIIKEFESENWMKFPVSLFGAWTQFTQPS